MTPTELLKRDRFVTLPVSTPADIHKGKDHLKLISSESHQLVKTQLQVQHNEISKLRAELYDKTLLETHEKGIVTYHIFTLSISYIFRASRKVTRSIKKNSRLLFKND